MEPEWYRLEVSGRINGGYVVRADRDRPDGFAVAAFSWVIFPPSVTRGTGRAGAAAVRRVAEAVERCRLWSLPATDGRSGFDNTFFYLDAVHGGRSHRVERWSPFDPEQADFLALCRLLSDIGREAAGVGWW